MRLALGFVICSLLQGCWFIYIPAGLFSGPGVQSQLDNFARDIESKEKFTAVAVAKDQNRWAWGGAHGAATAASASESALQTCNQSRQQEGVASPCHLYRVNGLPYAGR